jgi:hypothetical protein
MEDNTPATLEKFSGLIEYARAHQIEVPAPANISSVKTAESSANRVARKSQKRFRDTPRFKFQELLAQIQPFLFRSVEKRGDQSWFQSLGLYTLMLAGVGRWLRPYRREAANSS